MASSPTLADDDTLLAAARRMPNRIDPNLKRSFNRPDEMDQEHRDVRVWGGIHLRNPLDAGYEMSRKIAAYLVENSIKRVR